MPVTETPPRCPICKRPMGGGRGGMPWRCFRGCEDKPRPASRQLYPPGLAEKSDAPPCPKCGLPMGGGRGGMPWTCFRICKSARSNALQAAVEKSEPSPLRVGPAALPRLKEQCPICGTLAFRRYDQPGKRSVLFLCPVCTLEFEELILSPAAK